MQHMLLEYTVANPIVVIATVSNKGNLNKRIYSSRGRHLFQTIYKLADLAQTDREKIIGELCQKTNSDRSEVRKFSILTEGYSMGDLVQFVERAQFYAHKNGKNVFFLLSSNCNF